MALTAANVMRAMMHPNEAFTRLSYSPSALTAILAIAVIANAVIIVAAKGTVAISICIFSILLDLDLDLDLDLLDDASARS